MRRLLPVIALLLLLAGSWLFRAQQLAPRPTVPADHNPDYFIAGLAVTTMDQQGQPKQRLDSAHAIHYPDDDSLHLERPRMWIRDEQARRWTISAEQGTVFERGERIELERQVVILQPSAEGRQPPTLKTEQLTILPDKDYAESHSRVVASDAKGYIEARGMRAWLDKGRIELLAEARGEYAP